MLKMIALKKITLILLSISILLTQTGCEALKPKKVSAKDFPPDPRKRVEKNINEGHSFFPKESILCHWCYFWDECSAKTIPNPARSAR